MITTMQSLMIIQLQVSVGKTYMGKAVHVKVATALATLTKMLVLKVDRSAQDIKILQVELSVLDQNDVVDEIVMFLKWSAP